VYTVQQLISTQGKYDWASWVHKGYHLMGGVPVHLVGSEYLTEDLQPFEVIKIMEQEGGDDVEQLIAQATTWSN
jgi:hypothetical protein